MTELGSSIAQLDFISQKSKLSKSSCPKRPRRIENLESVREKSNIRTRAFSLYCD